MRWYHNVCKTVVKEMLCLGEEQKRRKQDGGRWKREERQGKERGRCGGREERSTKKGREKGKRGDDIVYQK